MKMGNDIYSISRSNIKKAVFEKCLNEACRQWCEFIDEAPERKNGEGFAHFFYVTRVYYYVMVSEKRKCTKYTKMYKSGKSCKKLSSLVWKVINIKK